MTLRDEEPSKMPFSSFSDDHLLLDMQPSLKCSFFPQWDSLEETKLSSASGYQLEVASGLQIGACVRLSLL